MVYGIVTFVCSLILWFGRRKKVEPVFNVKPPEEPQEFRTDIYYRVELTDQQRAYLLKHVLPKQPQTALVKMILERVQLAEQVPLPHTPRVNWEWAEEWERRFGYSVVDQFFDGRLRKPPEDPKPESD